jgi:hypothetical protein
MSDLGSIGMLFSDVVGGFVEAVASHPERKAHPAEVIRKCSGFAVQKIALDVEIPANRPKRDTPVSVQPEPHLLRWRLQRPAPLDPLHDHGSAASRIGVTLPSWVPRKR